MTWIKLDDKCPRHPKVAGLSDRAFRWWILALCYASEFLTDGVLPEAFLRGVPKPTRAELMASSLWRVDGDRIVVHDYLSHQTSKADVERERARNRQRRTGGTKPVQHAPVATSEPGRTVEKPRPENREQRSDSEADTDPPAQNAGGARVRGGQIMSPAEYERLKAFNAYVGERLRVPHKLHGDFVAELGGPEPDTALRAFYAVVDEEISISGESINPNVWKWLNARFQPWKASRAGDVEMAKFLAGEV